MFMLACYVILFLYFKSKGGYKAVDLDSSGHEAGSHSVTHADQAIADGSRSGGEA